MGTMSKRNIVKLLLDEARWKPVIKQLIDTAMEMTPEEISELKTPLPWHKKALLELTSKKKNTVAAEQFAELMGEIVHSPILGSIARYNGPDIELTPPSHTGSTLTIKVPSGALLFITTKDIWMGSFSLGRPIISYTVVKSDVPRNEYIEQLSGSEAPDPTLHSSGLFRIIRNA